MTTIGSAATPNAAPDLVDAHISRAGVRNKKAASANRVLAYSYLANHPCVDCGESDPVVLEFDHILTKHRDVSLMSRTAFSSSAVVAEIAKCVVRCGNCHRRKTAREQGSYELKAGFAPLLEIKTSFNSGVGT